MNTRAIGILTALVSGLVVIVSAWFMAGRVAHFNESRLGVDFHYRPTVARRFEAFGRPVSILDEIDERGQTFVRLTYGDDTRLIPIKDPPVQNIPDLGIYAEWLVPLYIRTVARGTPSGPDAPRDAEILEERLVIVKRNTPPGYDPTTWGTVRRADWTFEFYELLPDGSIDTRLFRFPRADRGERGLMRRVAAYRAGEIPTGREELARLELALAEIEPLRQRSWEYGAALHVIPKLQVPTYNFRDDAVGAMGWTLPVAGFGVLGFLAGIGLALRPSRRTKFTPAEKRPTP